MRGRFIPMFSSDWSRTSPGDTSLGDTCTAVLLVDIEWPLVHARRRYRPDLKLLISSATLDAEKFSDYFDDAPIFR